MAAPGVRPHGVVRLLPWLLLAAGVCNALPRLGRELWFDEALTALHFMWPLSFGEIYRNYVIPNNQIVYTELLKLWDMLIVPGLVPDRLWRLPSLLLALGTLALLWRRRRAECRQEAGTGDFAVLLALAVSVPFAIYATAIRGYAASWFFLLLALEGAWLLCSGKRAAGGALYAVGALLAVGTIPTNLMGLAAVGAYALPWCGARFWRKGEFYWLLFAPFLMFALFYLPILPRLLGVMKLGEGWSDRTLALAVSYGAIGWCFGPLVLLIGAGAVRDARSGRRLRLVRQALWLLPAAVIAVLPVAPFPRIFVTLFPLYALVLADGAAALTARWGERRVGSVLLLAVAVWAAAAQGWFMSAARQPGGFEDDFFAPWYMRADFSPAATAQELLRLAAPGALPEVAVSFPADPLPVIFYLNLFAATPVRAMADIPVGRIKAPPPGSWLLLRYDEAVAGYERRFGALDEIGATAYHRIFRVRGGAEK